MLAFLLLALAADVTPETAQRLHVAWTFHTNATPPDKRSAAKAAFEATPVLGGDMLYVITPYNQVIALDPQSGVEQWRYDPGLPSDRSYSEVTSRGVAFSNGRIFFGTLDARLIALDAKTGKLIWQTRIGEQNNDGNYQVTSPPVVLRDLVIVGSAI